jgi:hypothetical protein
MHEPYGMLFRHVVGESILLLPVANLIHLLRPSRVAKFGIAGIPLRNQNIEWNMSMASFVLLEFNALGSGENDRQSPANKLRG